MNKIKRGVSLLLCSLLFGSAVTLGNVADVQAGKQIKTETKQTINNTKKRPYEKTIIIINFRYYVIFVCQ